jgi:hypothetical protein
MWGLYRDDIYVIIPKRYGTPAPARRTNSPEEFLVDKSEKTPLNPVETEFHEVL